MSVLSKSILANYVPPQDLQIELPNYDLSKVKPGVVHIGGGNFSAGHMAVLTHDLAQSGNTDALNYGVVVVSLITPDRVRALQAQDFLYTLVEKDADAQNKMKVVGSIADAIYAPEAPKAVLDYLVSNDTRIVTMTITPQTHQAFLTPSGDLNTSDPLITSDLNYQNAPRTILGFLARSIVLREKMARPGFTIMNLDNMEHNGEAFRRSLTTFLSAYKQAPGSSALDFEDILRRKYAFPNSMVDRIVPGTTDGLRASVKEITGYTDAAAVPAEPMPKYPWVMERKFAAGQPAWSEVGALVVDNALDYEKLKLRILNVSHALMANLGDLKGLELIDQTMRDELIRIATFTLMANETGPTVPSIPGLDLPAYQHETVARFTNPEVRDTTTRVARDAPLAVVLLSASDQLEVDGPIELLALCTAAWIRRFVVTQNEAGGPIVAEHKLAPLMRDAAEGDPTKTSKIMQIKEIFGDIGENSRFAEAVHAYALMLNEDSVDVALQYAIDASNYSSAYRPGSKAVLSPNRVASGHQTPIPPK